MINKIIKALGLEKELKEAEETYNTKFSIISNLSDNLDNNDLKLFISTSKKENISTKTNLFDGNFNNKSIEFFYSSNDLIEAFSKKNNFDFKIFSLNSSNHFNLVILKKQEKSFKREKTFLLKESEKIEPQIKEEITESNKSD